MKGIGRIAGTARTEGFVLLLALLAGLALVMILPHLGLSQATEERVIYLATIEPKGGASVDKEPFPGTAFPKGGSYELKAPNNQGRWEVSTYQYSPSTIVVRQGERVTLEFIGINGAKHLSRIDHYHPQHFTVKRGEITRVQFTADKSGLFTIRCDDHQPAMTGTLVVLPR